MITDNVYVELVIEEKERNKMTITQTIGKTIGTIRIKTEIELVNDKAVFTRIIDSKIYQMSPEVEGEISMKQVAAICKLDDEMFKILSAD